MGVWRCCGVRFYPCQLFTPFSVWTAQKRTRLVAVDSASAPTRIARRIEACGIAAPPRCVLLWASVLAVAMCSTAAAAGASSVISQRVQPSPLRFTDHHHLSNKRCSYNFLALLSVAHLGHNLFSLIFSRSAPKYIHDGGRDRSRPARCTTPLTVGNTQAMPPAVRLS